jgi:hypothetical protein
MDIGHRTPLGRLSSPPASKHARSLAQSSPSLNCDARHSLVRKNSLCPQTLSTQVDFIVVPLARSVARQLP